MSSRITEARQRVDRAGAVLGGLGLFAVVYGFAHAATKSGSAGWTDPQTIGSIAADIVLLVAFVIAERRVAYPLLPLRVVLDRNRGGYYSATLLASIGLFSVFLFLTYYLETIQGYSPVRTGLAFLPLTVTVLFSAGVSNNTLWIGTDRRPVGQHRRGSSGIDRHLGEARPPEASSQTNAVPRCHARLSSWRRLRTRSQSIGSPLGS